MGLTYDPVYRSEVFTASDGQPGVRLVPVTQDEYDRMRVQLVALREVARAAKQWDEIDDEFGNGGDRHPANALDGLKVALAKLDNLEPK